VDFKNQLKSFILNTLNSLIAKRSVSLSASFFEMRNDKSKFYFVFFCIILQRAYNLLKNKRDYGIKEVFSVLAEATITSAPFLQISNYE